MSSNGVASGYGIDGTTTNAGSKSNPWAINDLADLTFLRDNSSYWGASVYYQQTNNIILSENNYNVGFLGFYNGNGYSIDGNSTYFVGFKNESGPAFRISNLHFKNTKSITYGATPYQNLIMGGYAINCIFENAVTSSVNCGSGLTFVEQYNAYAIYRNCIRINGSSTGGTTSGTRYSGGFVSVWGTNELSYGASVRVTNCVVINTTVSGSTYNNRISYVGTLSNNYATNGGSIVTGKDGLNITSTEYSSKSWWEDTALYNFDSKYGAWTWNSTTNLPELSHNVETYDVFIYDYADLSTFAAKVNSGETSLNAILMDDIDCTDQTWVSIGTSTYPYAGTFNGNGHAISNVTVTVTNVSTYYELILGLNTISTIKNIAFNNISITATGASGYDCYAHILRNFYLVEQCSFDSCTINTTGASGHQGHSILVESAITVQNCYATNTICYGYGPGAAWHQGSGTAVFWATSVINCYAYISNLYGRGGTSSDRSWTGTFSSAYYDMSGKSISNCVAIESTIQSTGVSVKIGTGGHYSGSAPTITNCYATNGGTSASSTNGLNITATQYNDQSFWDGTGISGTTYLDWDFDDVWYWDSDDNLPKLRAFKSGASVFLKTSGSWIEGIPYIKVNGTWIQADAVYVKVNGTWQLQQ